MSTLDTTRAALTRLRTLPGERDAVLAGIEHAAGGPAMIAGYADGADPDAVWLHEVGRGDDPAGLVDGLLAEPPRRHRLTPLRETAPGENLAAGVLPGPGREGPVVILARLLARAGGRAELVAALEPFMRVADSEPGTEIFTVYADDGEPDVVWLHEVYASSAAYQTHVDNPLHRTLREHGELTGGPTLSATLAGPPENFSLRPRFQLYGRSA